MQVVAVFHNRTQAMQFANGLKPFSVLKIINTPRDISVSCGLSVLFNINNLNKARIVINSGKFNSFGGFYLKKDIGFRFIYEKIN